MIYLLTAVGLPPGGSSTVHIYTQKTHITTQNKQYIEQHKNFGRVRAVPRLCELYPGICPTTEEKERKILSQGSRRVPGGTMKIHNHKLRKYRRNNKNTPFSIYHPTFYILFVGRLQYQIPFCCFGNSVLIQIERTSLCSPAFCNVPYIL
jgi:hypothetical protein